MAEEKENSLIGYDPLAWMLESDEESRMPAAPVDIPEADRNSDEPKGAEVAGDPWHETALESSQDAPPSMVAKIELASVLSIQHVAQLQEQLLEALDGFDTIEIDASAVTTADTATLQLLLVLKRTAIKRQKEVVIDFPSERFVEACDLLGIAEMLGVDQAASGFF